MLALRRGVAIIIAAAICFFGLAYLGILVPSLLLPLFRPMCVTSQAVLMVLAASRFCAGLAAGGAAAGASWVIGRHPWDAVLGAVAAEGAYVVDLGVNYGIWFGPYWIQLPELAGLLAGVALGALLVSAFEGRRPEPDPDQARATQ